MAPLVSMLLALGTMITLGQDPVEKRTFALPHVLEAVGKAIDQPAPDGLNVADQKAYAAETEWLKSVRKRIEPLAVQSEPKAPRDVATGQASGKRQHGALPIRGWSALQTTFEQEGRQFDQLQGALKVRHEMVMNAIRNLKG